MLLECAGLAIVEGESEESMSGFFDVLKRLAQGKPGFENEEDVAAQKPEPVPNEPQATIRKGDENSFPVVHVTRLAPRLNGARLQVYGWIVNMWPEEIMLDKIRAFGGVRELDSFLRGHEEREFLLYDGALPTRQEYEALLDYKTQHEGDYFEAIHDVKYTYRAEDKTYIPDEMRLRHPIRDIYG